MRYKTNEKGTLLLGGIPATTLAKKYGTPLYVMESDKITSTMNRFTTALTKYYGGNGLICYASKAFCCKEMCRMAAVSGFGLDVVSCGELYTAFNAGFDMSKICLHGNNKTPSELSLALEYGVKRIVVDNLSELALLDRLCEDSGKRASVLLRIKPGIDAHSHSYVCTALVDSKFGLGLETDEAMNAVISAIKYKNIDLLGLHCHIGSQILTLEPYRIAVDTMVRFMAEIKKQTGVELTELNLGGGFGISYTSDEITLDIDECIKIISVTLNGACTKYGIKKPFLLLEPGRSIVAESGTTLYTVGSIKHIPSVRTYVAVDGGMTDNPRYALYKSKYDMVIANKAMQKKDSVVTVAGKCCESGDLLGENVELQTAETGDILAVFCTGAYNFSMSSHYNRNLRPAVVAVSGGKSKIIVKRDTLKDIVRNDI